MAEFFSPKEVLESLSNVYKNAEIEGKVFTEDIVADHLSMICLTLQKQFVSHYQEESKLYSDLIQRCQDKYNKKEAARTASRVKV